MAVCPRPIRRAYQHDALLDELAGIKVERDELLAALRDLQAAVRAHVRVRSRVRAEGLFA